MNNQTNKNKFLFIAFFFLIVLSFITVFVSQNQKLNLRPKASGAGIGVVMVGNAAVPKAENSAYALTVKITKPEATKIVYTRLRIQFPTNIFKSTATDVAVVYNSNYFSKSAAGADGLVGSEAIDIADGKRDESTGVIKPQMTADLIVAVVTFKVKAGVGDGTGGTFVSHGEVVGESGSLVVDSHPDFNITAGTGPSTTVAPTVTVPADAITLDLKLKFQGILDKTKIAAGKENMTIKVKLSGGTLTQPTVSQSAVFTVDNDAVWHGRVTFTGVAPGNNFRILIKGPKHQQKKICIAAPTETHPATYRCSDGRITLQRGVNTFDFSRIVLLCGDLPDQNGVVDSYDAALIKTSIADGTYNDGADVNFDGRVDNVDFSLFSTALSIRGDEE